MSLLYVSYFNCSEVNDDRRRHHHGILRRNSYRRHLTNNYCFHWSSFDGYRRSLWTNCCYLWKMIFRTMMQKNFCYCYSMLLHFGYRFWSRCYVYSSRTMAPIPLRSYHGFRYWCNCHACCIEASNHLHQKQMNGNGFHLHYTLCLIENYSKMLCFADLPVY